MKGVKNSNCINFNFRNGPNKEVQVGKINYINGRYKNWMDNWWNCHIITK